MQVAMQRRSVWACDGNCLGAKGPVVVHGMTGLARTILAGNTATSGTTVTTAVSEGTMATIRVDTPA